MSKKVPCSFCTEKIDARSIGAHEKKHIRMGDHKVSVSNGVPVLKLISEKTVIVSKDLSKALLIGDDGHTEPVKIVRF